MNDSYRPSNGTEGMGFYENWCSRCKHDRRDDADGGCDILRRTFIYNINDPEYPSEWIYNDAGNPKCTAFEEVES